MKRATPALDPLCDLYDRGFSGAVSETMHARAQVAPRAGSAGGAPFADSMRPPRRSAGALQQPLDAAIEPMGYEFVSAEGSSSSSVAPAGAAGEVDFYDWDDDSVPTSRGMEDATEYDHFHEDDEEEEEEEAMDRAQRRVTFSPPTPPLLPPPPALAATVSIERYASPAAYPAPPPPTAVDGTAFAMDMGLYVISGIMLIFLMEQFIQIGVRLR